MLNTVRYRSHGRSAAGKNFSDLSNQTRIIGVVPSLLVIVAGLAVYLKL